MASAVKAAAGAIYSHLSSNITSIATGWSANTNVAWPGVDYDPASEWIRPTIIWNDGELETMSSGGTNVISGILVLSLFDRPGSGYGVLNGYADKARDLFDRASPGSSVEFLAASGPRQVNQTDTRWLQINISVPFLLEETS